MGITFLIGIVVLMFLALVKGTVDAAIGLITVLFWAFVVKNIVQDVILGFLKNRNTLGMTIWHFAIDMARIWLYFTMVNRYAVQYASSGGIGFFGAMFNFILYFVIGGALFLAGEILSILHVFRTKAEDTQTKHFSIGADIACLAVLGGFSLLCII